MSGASLGEGLPGMVKRVLIQPENQTMASITKLLSPVLKVVWNDGYCRHKPYEFQIYSQTVVVPPTGQQADDQLDRHKTSTRGSTKPSTTFVRCYERGQPVVGTTSIENSLKSLRNCWSKEAATPGSGANSMPEAACGSSSGPPKMISITNMAGRGTDGVFGQYQ
jgi:preprotein translocase subunit SecA